MWRVTVFLATLAIAMFMGSGEPALAQSTVVRIEPAWKVVSPQDPPFSIQVRVDNVVTRNPCTPYSTTKACGLGAYEFTLVYDPAVIGLQSVVNGPFLGSTGRIVSCNTYYPEPDRVRYLCYTLPPGEPPGPMGPTGSGLLATVTFAPLQIGSSPADLQNVILADVTGDPIPHTVQDGSVTVDYSADLSVEKTAPGTVTAPGNIEYGVQVTNLGPDEAENVTVVDTLSSHVDFESASPGCTYDGGQHKVTCPLGNIGATLSESVSITVSVEATAAGRTIVNEAHASSATLDDDTENDDDDASTTVDPANVDIVKSAPDQVEKGAEDQYEIVVTSTGPSDACQVTVTDVLPSDVVYVSSSTTLGYCIDYEDAGERIVWCAVGDMATSTSGTITITVSFPDFDWYVCNKAQSEWTQTPPGLNESQWECTEVGEPDRDGDGCFNWRELGDNPTLGGQRDPDNPWDFFDVPLPVGDPGTGTRDKQVDGNDALAVLAKFGATPGDPIPGAPPYDPAYDRSTPSPEPWSTQAPDGVQDGNDVIWNLAQFGHSCYELP